MFISPFHEPKPAKPADQRALGTSQCWVTSALLPLAFYLGPEDLTSSLGSKSFTTKPPCSVESRSCGLSLSLDFMCVGDGVEEVRHQGWALRPQKLKLAQRFSFFLLFANPDVELSASSSAPCWPP